MRRARTFIAVLILLSCVAYAQIQSGNIYGTVVESSGTPLPGVAVTLVSARTGELTTISSEDGRYRFLNLPPAKDYSLTFGLDGFKTEVRRNIRVIIGENVTINIQMNVGEITERVTVEGRPPVIDIRKTTAATNVTQEELQSLPTARDPWAILQKAPGLAMDRENVGGNESGQQSSYTARGGGRANSQWNVDGVEVTDPTAPGTSGMYYDYDMFEEMQIQTAANDVTAMTGGVNINFVTRRGSDRISGGARFYLTDDAFQSDNLPDNMAQDDLSGNTINNIADYGFNIGGPISKGKAWFWLSYGVQDINLFDVRGDADDTLLRTLNGKFNLTLGSHRIEVYGVYNDKIKEGRKRYPLDLYEAGRKQTGPAYIFKLQDDITVGNNMLITLKASYTPTAYTLEPYGGRDKAVYEIYNTYRYNTGTWEEIESEILSGSIALNYFKDNFIFGDHEIKLGVEYRYSHSREASQLGNGLHLQIRPGRSLYYGTLYRDWDIDYELNRLSIWLQDAINMGRVTLNIGLRMDRQSGGIREHMIPGTSIPVAEDIEGMNLNWAPLTQPATDLPFSFSFFSPRIGLIWDLSGNGRTVAKANFALYGSVLDAGYIDTLRIDSYHELDWYDDNGNDMADPGELYLYRTRDNSAMILDKDSQFFFDDNLKPERTMEVVMGIERELMRDFRLGLNLIYRRITNHTWTVPYVWDGGYRLVRNSDWAQFSVNEEGTDYTFWDTLDVYDEGIGFVTQRPDYNVVYKGLELTFNKAFSNRWMISGSLTLQDTKVHYDSAAAYIDPTDHQPDKLDVQPGPHSYGRFVMNSRWMFKFNWIYQLPWEINFAGSLNVRDGYIFPRVRTLFDAGRRYWDYTEPVVLLENYGASRYDTFWNLDLRLEKMFNLDKLGRLYISLDAFNVTNNDMVLSQGNDIALSNYLVTDTMLNPRVFRLGARFEF